MNGQWLKYLMGPEVTAKYLFQENQTHQLSFNGKRRQAIKGLENLAVGYGSIWDIRQISKVLAPPFLKEKAIRQRIMNKEKCS